MPVTTGGPQGPSGRKAKQRKARRREARQGKAVRGGARRGEVVGFEALPAGLSLWRVHRMSQAAAACWLPAIQSAKTKSIDIPNHKSPNQRHPCHSPWLQFPFGSTAMSILCQQPWVYCALSGFSLANGLVLRPRAAARRQVGPEPCEERCRARAAHLRLHRTHIIRPLRPLRRRLSLASLKLGDLADGRPR